MARAPLPRVEVTCPVCKETRLVLQQQVRRQTVAGTFTGVCRKDMHIGRRRAEVGAWAQSLEWATSELAEEGALRRRSRYVIYCPRCGSRRTVAKVQARGEIKAGTFTLLCAVCRLV